MAVLKGLGLLKKDCCPISAKYVCTVKTDVPDNFNIVA